MSALKYKDTDGTWKEVTSLNQVVTVEKEVPVINGTWKTITVRWNLPDTTFRQPEGQEAYFDLSAANIDLLESDNWFLVFQLGYYAAQNQGGGMRIISPILATYSNRDKRESMFTKNTSVIYPEDNGVTYKDFFTYVGTLLPQAYSTFDYHGYVSNHSFRYTHHNTEDSCDICSVVTLFYLDNEEA